MNRLRKALGRWVDKWRGTFYEGPEPPRRIGERVKAFRLYNPDADPAEWAAFAERLARNCYREGFVRGYEWLERSWEGPAKEPERLAELAAHDWSLAEEHPDWSRMLEWGYDPRSPLRALSPEQRQAVVDTFTAGGGYPVEIDLSAYDGEAHGNPGFHDDDT